MKDQQVLQQPRRRWTSPVLAYRGTVGEVLKGGGGKVTTSAYDPGEHKCPPALNKCG